MKSVIKKPIWDLSPAPEWSVSSTLSIQSLKRQTWHFFNPEMKFFKSPRQNSHIDSWEAFKDSIDQCDVKQIESHGGTPKNESISRNQLPTWSLLIRKTNVGFAIRCCHYVIIKDLECSSSPGWYAQDSSEKVWTDLWRSNLLESCADEVIFECWSRKSFIFLIFDFWKWPLKWEFPFNFWSVIKTTSPGDCWRNLKFKIGSLFVAILFSEKSRCQS